MAQRLLNHFAAEAPAAVHFQGKAVSEILKLIVDSSGNKFGLRTHSDVPYRDGKTCNLYQVLYNDPKKGSTAVCMAITVAQCKEVTVQVSTNSWLSNIFAKHMSESPFTVEYGFSLIKGRGCMDMLNMMENDDVLKNDVLARVREGIASNYEKAKESLQAIQEKRNGLTDPKAISDLDAKVSELTTKVSELSQRASLGDQALIDDMRRIADFAVNGVNPADGKMCKAAGSAVDFPTLRRTHGGETYTVSDRYIGCMVVAMSLYTMASPEGLLMLLLSNLSKGDDAPSRTRVAIFEVQTFALPDDKDPWSVKGDLSADTPASCVERALRHRAPVCAFVDELRDRLAHGGGAPPDAVVKRLTVDTPRALKFGYFVTLGYVMAAEDWFALPGFAAAHAALRGRFRSFGCEFALAPPCWGRPPAAAGGGAGDSWCAPAGDLLKALEAAAASGRDEAALRALEGVQPPCGG